VDAKDHNGNTPLINAIEFSRDDLFHVLLDAGADVNIVDPVKQSPLMLAAQSGNLAYCKALLDKGANLNKRDIEGKTALYMAIFEGHDDIATLLIGNNASLERLTNGYTPLHWATVMGRDKVSQLIASRIGGQ
jgi:ankyrin repeat protein